MIKQQQLNLIFKIASFFLSVFILSSFLSIYGNVKEIQVDKSKSIVGFNVNQFGLGMVEGKFENYDIYCEINGNTITSLNASIKIESIKTGNKTRDRHLQSKQFFYAKKHPKIVFEMIKPIKLSDTLLYGKLTIRGVEIELAIPVEIKKSVENNKQIIIAKTINHEFNRDIFGLLTYVNLISNLVQSNIYVTFSSDEI